MLVETIYATHNIFDLDKLHRNLRRIMRRSLANKSWPRTRRWRPAWHITVLIITYLSETKPVFMRWQYLFWKWTTQVISPEDIMRRDFDPDARLRNAQETMFGYNALVSSTETQRFKSSGPSVIPIYVLTHVIRKTLTRELTSTHIFIM